MTERGRDASSFKTASQSKIELVNTRDISIGENGLVKVCTKSTYRSIVGASILVDKFLNFKRAWFNAGSSDFDGLVDYKSSYDDSPPVAPVVGQRQNLKEAPVIPSFRHNFNLILCFDSSNLTFQTSNCGPSDTTPAVLP